ETSIPKAVTGEEAGGGALVSDSNFKQPSHGDLTVRDAAADPDAHLSRPHSEERYKAASRWVGDDGSADTTSQPRGAIASEFCVIMSPDRRGSRECRAPAALAALCANGRSTQASHHRFSSVVRHSLRGGVNGFLRALLGDQAL